MLSLFKKDIFGNPHLIKKWVIRIVGIVSYRRFRGINNLIITGTENIKNLPEKNVLFISNHQTYFADASAIIHVINATLSGRSDTIKNVSYIWKPKLNLYFIAAKETMRDGWLPKILSYAGSIPIERTWRDGGKDVVRSVNKVNIKAINRALEDGWVITFPQGTTKPWMPVRKGTAHIIKTNRPVVIPIVIDGFRRSFDRKGLYLKKRGVNQKLEVKPPLDIDYDNDSLDNIVQKIGESIEQIQA
jgi:1-acyl-sn-glycerol-3-phosphate acyltransferase